MTPKQKDIFKKYPLVHVIWEDAHSTGGWLESRDIDVFTDERDGVISEIGHLIEQTDRHIILASKVSALGTFGGVMKIPRTWAKVTILKQ